MMPPDVKKRGLGCGLGALLPTPAPAPTVPLRGDKQRQFFTAGIEDIYPSPEQPRRRFDEGKLAELADTIKVHGVNTPLVEDEKLSMGHARALLSLDEPAAMERAARQVIDKQLSVRAAEALVKKLREPAAGGPRGAAGSPAARLLKSASVRDLEDRLTRALGGPVTITEDEPGKAGTVEIRYMDLDHLDRLLDKLL